jgi:hypothetical protein
MVGHNLDLEITILKIENYRPPGAALLHTSQELLFSRRVEVSGDRPGCFSNLSYRTQCLCC